MILIIGIIYDVSRLVPIARTKLCCVSKLDWVYWHCWSFLDLSSFWFWFKFWFKILSPSISQLGLSDCLTGTVGVSPAVKLPGMS